MPPLASWEAWEASPLNALRAVALSSVLLLGALPFGLASGPTPEPAPCAGYQVVPTLGPACPEAGGWRVFHRDGTSGWTHGVDMPPASGVVASGPYGTPIPPVCVDESQYHTQLVYAHARDRPDRYAAMAPVLRAMVNQTNGHLRQEAAEFGSTISYKFHCEAPDIVSVARPAPLATSDATTSFSSIVNDLRDQGYTHAKKKYMIWYDGGNGGGVGYFRGDSSLSASNANMFGPDYGVTFGATGDWGVLVLMHENAHNLGAVQNNAPYTSGGAHCNDGLDIMCYSDGGSNSSYSETRCRDRRHFDCAHDSYFNPDPVPGTYIAAHWNLGHVYNRFFDFSDQPPFLSTFWCTPNPSNDGSPVQCRFRAETARHEVFYTLTWGDGTTERVPATGSVPGGTTMDASHVYGGKGLYTLTLNATDTGVPPRTSRTMTTTQSISCTFERANTLLVGLNGYELERYSARTESNVPRACWGDRFVLTMTPNHEFDMCWMQGTTVLQCHVTAGDEEGVVPEGADSARIVYRLGATGAYFLRVV